MTDQSQQQLIEKIDLLEKLVRRRFDEISMEINATSQQIGHVEQDIAGQFKDIMGTLAAVSFKGDGKSQVNAGLELQAVIQDTESAANNIMDAADRIAVRLKDTAGDWSDASARDRALGEIKDEVQTILMACTFQDLTSQRIRKAIENLQMIEARLSSTLERLGIRPDVSAADIIGEANKTRLQSQADIDALFN